MSKKNRTLTELQQNIDEDFIQRRNELHLLKELVERNLESVSGKVYSKNLIVFLYAHWEGFIKYSSECFLQFMSHQKLKNKELNYGLLAVSNLAIINEFMESRVALKIRAIENILATLEAKAKIPYEYLIATYSNLSAEILEEICLIIGIDENFYSLKKGIIDEKLLRNRNNIAHGSLERIEPKESLEIFQLVFPILETFKDDVLNRAVKVKHP